MDKLLQSGGSQGNTGGTGQLAQTEVALSIVEAVEETVGTFKDAAKSGSGQGSRDDVSISHGAWWNLGASHMNQAIKTARFRRMGLISLLEQ